MSLCPYCFQANKEFFSDKCDACNTEVALSDQVAASVWSVVSTIIIWATVIAVVVILVS